MIESYIKYYIFLAISLYLFGKMLNLKISAKKTIYNLIFFLFSNTLIYIIRVTIPSLTIFMLLVVLFTHATITYKNSFQLTITTSLLSIVLCYLHFLCANIVSSIIFGIMHSYTHITERVQFASLLLSLFIQILLCFSFLKIKRLKKGMPFLRSKLSNTVGIFVACCTLLISSLFTVLNEANHFYIWITLTAFILGTIFIIWWRKQLTSLYINRSSQNYIDRLQTELDSIRQDNERLGAIIHKDNKLIPAMMMSVQTALSAQLHSGDDNNFELNALLSELEALYAERSTLSQAQLSAKCPLPESKLIRLDMMLKYMYQKSENLGIQMTADFQIDIKEMLSKQFSEDFLVTIVADLIDNAIIATNLSSEYKKIHIDFAKENDNYCIAVYDTGIPFELHTIKYAGIKKASTHLDNGGSGIGLMSTFTLLKDSYSSFVIDETIDKDNYTKKVAIVMDRLNEYRVYTQRPDILALRTSNPNITFCS